MSYSIRIRKQALKEIEKLPTKNSIEVSKAIDNLANDPRPAGSKKLKGQKEIIWRIRVGDFRVLYIIDDKIKIVEIRKVGDRKDIYK